MKKKSLGKNAVLNTFKSLMGVIFPLITFPYVSRVLGVDSLGKYNFAYSVNSYFLMIAALGISSYAVREGAPLRDDREKFNHFSSQVYTINLISSAIAYALVGLSLLLIPKFQNYTACILVFSIEIIFTTIGVEWVYIINEEYAYITFRRIAFQLISMVLLFTLVKDENDVIVYCAISVFANAGANILNVFNVRKYCKLRIVKDVEWGRHLKPIMIIFASTVAVKIYTSSDTVMLGFFCGDHEVGLYSVAVKIYNVLKPLLSAISVVSIPRLAAYAGKNDMVSYQRTAKQIFSSLLVIILPAVVGLFMLSENAILFLSGAEYIDANLSLKLLSVAVAFSIFSSFYNQCALIPMKLEKSFLVATIVSACVNIGLNFVLIPLFGQNGAAFTTVVSEFVSMFMCYMAARKKVRIKQMDRTVFSSLIGCVAIVLICLWTTSNIASNILCIVVSVIASVVVYFALLILMKNPVIMDGLKSVVQKIKK